MKIHEYQAKEIFRNYHVRVPEGKPAFSVEEALQAYDEMGSETVVVKAQIHAGGRGKGGGIKIAQSLLKLCADEVRLPLVKVTEETKKTIRSALTHANLI